MKKSRSPKSRASVPLTGFSEILERTATCRLHTARNEGNNNPVGLQGSLVTGQMLEGSVIITLYEDDIWPSF
jgi:hypothetical protein